MNSSSLTKSAAEIREWIIACQDELLTPLANSDTSVGSIADGLGQQSVSVLAKLEEIANPKPPEPTTISVRVSGSIPLKNEAFSTSIRIENAEMSVNIRHAQERLAREALRRSGFPPHDGWPYIEVSPKEVVLIKHEVEQSTSHTYWTREILIEKPTPEQINTLLAWSFILGHTKKLHV